MVPLFNNSAGRFVLLRHEMPSTAALASHWDLMFDSGDLLLTFRLYRLGKDGVEILTATRLADHRRLYLDYEGEIAGGRGCVQRVAAGQFKVLSMTGTETKFGEQPARVELQSPELCGELSFEACAIHAETNIQVHAWQMPPARESRTSEIR